MPEPRVVAVSAALRWELGPLLRAFGPVQRLRNKRPATWRSRAHPVLIFRTGIGIEAARTATASVLAELPVAAVINSGCAGALVPEMVAGSVVVASAVIQPDRSPPGPPGAGAFGSTREEHAGRVFSTDERLADDFCEVTESLGVRTLRRVMLSSPTPLLSAAAKRGAHGRFGAVAVEMEGAGVAEASLERGVRFASVRVILDRADQDLPLDPAGSFSLLRIMARLARPAGIREVVGLRAAMHAAERGLERLFGAFARSRGARGWFDDGP